MTVVAGPASTRLGTEVSELLQVQALAVDDMLSTGGTIAAAVGALREAALELVRA